MSTSSSSSNNDDNDNNNNSLCDDGTSGSRVDTLVARIKANDVSLCAVPALPLCGRRPVLDLVNNNTAAAASTTTDNPLLSLWDTRRILTALAHNTTVTQLALLLPSGPADRSRPAVEPDSASAAAAAGATASPRGRSPSSSSSVDGTTGSPLDEDDQCGCYVFLTDLLATNTHLQTLSLLPSAASKTENDCDIHNDNTNNCNHRCCGTSRAWQAIAEGLRQNTSLVHVKIDGGGGGRVAATGSAAAAKAVAHWLATTITVTSLTLSNLSWNDPDDGEILQPLADGLHRNTSITSMECHQLRLSTTAGDRLLRALPRSLEALTLSDCTGLLSRTTSSDSFCLPAGLQTLRLVECRWTVESLVFLSSSTPCRPAALTTALTTIDLRGSRSCLASAPACGNLARAFLRDRSDSGSSSVRKLILEDCGITDAGLVALFGHPKNLPLSLSSSSSSALRKLNLSGNAFTDCSNLVRLHHHHPHLVELDLSNNAQIGATCGAALADLLRTNRSLLRLELEACDLTVETVECLCAALMGDLGDDNNNSNNGSSGHPGPPSSMLLRHLNLSYNAAVGAAMPAVAGVLQSQRCGATATTTKARLQSLYLASCRVTDSGVAALAAAVDGGSVLHELVLSHNAVGNAGVAHLAALLRRHPRHLRHLDLRGNTFDAPTGLASVVDSLADAGGNVYLTHVAVTLYGPAATPVKRRLAHWLLLNRAGRRHIRPRAGSSSGEHTRCWADVLAQADQIYGVQALYHFLSALPHAVLR